MRSIRLARTSSSLVTACFLALGALLVAGCGSGTSDSTSAAPRTSHAGRSPGMGMSGMDMGSSGDQPTETAAMICSAEIADSVVSALALPSTPETTDDWSDLLYTCTYGLPAGDLVLSVKDSPDETSGMAYFSSLRKQLDGQVGVQPIKGLSALGLPSYESQVGDVVFMKDGKTLHVDASGLPADVGSRGESRTEIAYQIATDVIACWSE